MTSFRAISPEMPIEETWGERWFVLGKLAVTEIRPPHAALRTTWRAYSNRGLDPLLGTQSAWVSPKNLHSWQCPQVSLMLLVSNRWTLGTTAISHAFFQEKIMFLPVTVPMSLLLGCFCSAGVTWSSSPSPLFLSITWHSQSRYRCHSWTGEKGAWERDPQQISSAFIIDICLPGLSTLKGKSGPGNIKEMHF